MKLFSLFLIILISINCYPQQFPFGVFANSGGPTSNRESNYPQMINMGINHLIDVTRDRPSSNFTSIDNVIGINASQLDDYIYLYTKGMLMDWNTQNNSPNNSVAGLRYSPIASESGDYIVSPDDPSLEGVFITGPYYFQYKTYKSNSGPYSDFPITYNAGLTLKIDGRADGDDPVLSIKASYIHDSIRYNVLKERIITASELSNNDTTLYFTYTLDSIPTFTSLTKRPDNELTIYNNINGNYDEGIEFTITWMGKRKLYIKNLRIYDELIGKILYSDSVISNVRTEVDRYASINNLKYFYSFDEPHSIDNYKPYRIVDNIVRNYTSESKSLITALYPEWNGSRDNQVTAQRFITEAQPKTFFFWYYPFWDNPKITTDSGYVHLINILNLHYDYGVRNFWIAPQAGGFWDSSFYRREVIPNEVLGQTMLSLAYGAKGIIYYQYYSQKVNDIYRATGLVDVWNGQEFPITNKYNTVKSISERLKGSLGKTLLSLNYQGQYGWLWKKLNNIKLEVNYIPFCNLIKNNQLENELKHIGYLKDSSGTDYLMLTNLDSIQTRDIDFSLRNSNYRNYKNIGIKNIESNFIGGFDGTYIDSLKTFKLLNVVAGDGVLLRIAPMVKYGGELVVNETVSDSIILRDNLNIPSGKTLTINSDYYLDDTLTINSTNSLNLSNTGYIILNSNGKVIVNSYGPLAKLKTKTTKHPWFIWGKYTGTNIYYKILRSVAGGTWTQIDTTSNLQYIDPTITVYTETGTSINVDYKVIASKRNDPLAVTSDMITYPVRGGMEKEGNEVALRYNYNLEQNYPNPFNPTTRIIYSLRNDVNVVIKLYDVLGNEKTVLLDDYKAAGVYSLEFNSAKYNLSSGVYFYSIKAGEYNSTKKMIILK